MFSNTCLADVRNENARVRSRGDMRGKMYEKFEFQLREKSIAVIVKPRAIGQTRLHINIYIYMILVWRDHVRFTYYYTYNINIIYAARIDGSTCAYIYLYAKMALSMAFTRCKTYNIAIRDRICIRYTYIIYKLDGVTREEEWKEPKAF